MKKLVLMMVIGLGAAFAAQADLIYFKASAFAWTGGPKYFDFAGVCVATTDGTVVDRLQIKPTFESSEYGDMVESDEQRYNAEGWADIADAAWKSDDYVFYVDAYDTSAGEWTEVYGYSEDTAKSYAQLKQQGSIYIPGSTDPQDVKPWNVPEPTSGMLLLLGSALLALKRKREK